MDSILAFFQNFPFELFVIQTLNGIVTGMILALIASGLTLIFGIMDVVNFAHGELFMLGAYVGVLVLATTGSFWLALILATLLVGLFGVAILLVEQNVPLTLEASQRVYIMEKGAIRHQAKSSELKVGDDVIKQYLGV